jgi:hypothetical protein
MLESVVRVGLSLVTWLGRHIDRTCDQVVGGLRYMKI